MKLSTNFSLAEMTKSRVASTLGIANIPDDKQIASLQALVDNILQPLRDSVGAPININSGFRSKALNSAIGGVDTSQHTKGEAADIEAHGWSNGDLFDAIRSLLPFDQVILEYHTAGQPKSGWVHVSYAKKQRGIILIKKDHLTPYERV